MANVTKEHSAIWRISEAAEDIVSMLLDDEPWCGDHDHDGGWHETPDANGNPCGIGTPDSDIRDQVDVVRKMIVENSDFIPTATIVEANENLDDFLDSFDRPLADLRWTTNYPARVARMFEELSYTFLPE